MRLHKPVVSLFVCILLLGFATVASAAPPPQGDDPLPPRDSGFDPVPIQSGRLVLDRSTGSVIYAELTTAPEPATQVAEGKQDASATFTPAGGENR
jgi:hypothetical protein